MTIYRGRFAPSPSGPLHFGSLVAALGSWLDAHHHKGKWLVRIEDIDPPREVAGAADNILKTLEAFGLHWDQSVTYQSSHLQQYQQLIQQLFDADHVYRCTCTRKQIKSTAGIYRNTCRTTDHPADIQHSLRLKIDEPIISFEDCFQGSCKTDLVSAREDYILKRKDSLYAYMIAVVADDIQQKITHVIRGADLLDTTTQQIYLYKLLNSKPPVFGHLPIAVNNHGHKLSKQNHAQAVSMDNTSETLWQVLLFLMQSPPDYLRKEKKEVLLDWAVKHWQPNAFAGKRQLLSPHTS